MSLIVWLPLNGDSHNQGLGKYTETTNTLSYAINGKVTEKCVNKGKLVYNKNPLQMVGTICFWIYPKPTAEKSSIIFGNNPFNDSNRKWTLFMYPNNKSLHSWGCQKEGSNTFNGSFTYENVLKESTWNHVCVAHDLENEYIYVNGNLIGTVPWDSSGTYNFDKETDIIRDESLETGVNNFKINDFRIYDTCLSKAEVKEIAKGKMLHYTFENPYATETTNIPHSIVIIHDNIGEVTLGSDSTGKYMNKTNMTFWSGIGIKGLLVKPGRYYTWSIELMPIKDIEYVIDGNIICNNSGHGGNDIQHYTVIRGYSHRGFKTDGTILSGTTTPKVKGKLEAYKWTRIYFTIKVKQDCTNPYINHTFVPYIPSGDTEVKVYYRNSQLEERMYDSPYTSSKRNPLTIKDNSGMGNNGTQVYQRIEIPIIKSGINAGTSQGSIKYDSTNNTYTITGFNSADNQCFNLGKIKYNSLYHYLGSVCSYEFDITLKDLVMVSEKTLSDGEFDSQIQGTTHFKDGTSSWIDSPTSVMSLSKRLGDGKVSNATFHICTEKQVTVKEAVTNVDYYNFGLRLNFIKSGTITISNLHAYYDDLDTSKLTIADKSVIGSHSLYLNGKNYINCGVVTPSMIDELTASIWLYRDDWTTKPMLPLYSSFFGAREGGGFAIGPNRDIANLHFEVYYNSVGYLYPNDIDMTKLSAGWHLITGVANKNRVALYLDGKLYNENVHNKNAQINMLPNNNSTIARVPMYIGAELDNWTTTPVLRTVKDYYMDDVRLYATALSDKDIKALYNVKTRIDNKSNLYCNQLIETKSENMMKPLNKVDLTTIYGFNSTGTVTYSDGIIKYLVTSVVPGSTNPTNNNSGMFVGNVNYGDSLLDNVKYRCEFYVRVSKQATYLLGEERLGFVRKTLESGKWYHIKQEAKAINDSRNLIVYNESKNLAKGDTIEVRDIKIYRLYNTDNYTQEITKKGQFRTFELNELKIDDTNYMGATIIDKYGAEWLEVFYHDNNNCKVFFDSQTEALHTNSQYKFSILDQLEKFRGNDGKFEFLLEYPTDIPGKYNRWKQTDNPVKVTANNTYASGYEAIHVDWSGNNWGGLLRAISSNVTLLKGSIVNSNTWFFAIGAIKAWDSSINHNGVPGPYTSASDYSNPNGIVHDIHLYVRIDNLKNNDNFKIYNRNTKANEIIEI